MISVRNHDELKAASFALKGMQRDLRNEINRATTKTIGPVWKQQVASKARTRTDQAVLVKGARLSGGNPPTLYAANSKRRMRGGLVPVEQWKGWEFGSKSRNNKRKYTSTSPKGKRHQVTRRTSRQMPPHAPKGRVVYPAFAETAPRLAALWTQLVVKKTFEALERGQ